jgi:hypothetical protein
VCRGKFKENAACLINAARFNAALKLAYCYIAAIVVFELDAFVSIILFVCDD